MVKFLYVVYDVVSAEVAGPVMLLPNDSAARRVFSDAVLAGDNMLAKHPADYVLLKLGELDTVRCVVTGRSVDEVNEHLLAGDVVMELAGRRGEQPDSSELRAVG